MTLKEELRGATQRAYQRRVLAEVRAGNFVAGWARLAIVRTSATVEIDVTSVPLALRSDEGLIYPMMSATLQQLVADEIGALLPTTLVCDEMWRQTKSRVQPMTRDWWKDGSMGEPFRLVEQSDAIAEKLSELPPGLVAFPWKTWVLGKPLELGQMREGMDEALNHGMYVSQGGSLTLGGEHVIQDEGGMHGRLEIDYSQVGVFMRNRCLVNGQEMPTADVLTSPELAFLLSDEGPLKVLRQPGSYGVDAFGPLDR